MNTSTIENDNILQIPEYEIKSFLEHKWNKFLTVEHLFLDFDLMKATCLEYTIDKLGTDFFDLDAHVRMSVRQQITQIIENWYENFLTLEGNWKFQKPKSLEHDG